MNKKLVLSVLLSCLFILLLYKYSKRPIYEGNRNKKAAKRVRTAARKDAKRTRKDAKKEAKKLGTRKERIAARKEAKQAHRERKQEINKEFEENLIVPDGTVHDSYEDMVIGSVRKYMIYIDAKIQMLSTKIETFLDSNNKNTEALMEKLVADLLIVIRRRSSIINRLPFFLNINPRSENGRQKLQQALGTIFEGMDILSESTLRVIQSIMNVERSKGKALEIPNSGEFNPHFQEIERISRRISLLQRVINDMNRMNEKLSSLEGEDDVTRDALHMEVLYSESQLEGSEETTGGKVGTSDVSDFMSSLR